MQTIKINPSDLSVIFWNKVLDNAFLKQKTIQKDFFQKIDRLDKLRKDSDYNTGSISSSSSWLLFSMVLFFKPQIIMEVGSFIGKSTISMALTADLNIDQNKCEIYCCDSSNKIIFPDISTTTIKQFHKTSSTEMLKSFSSETKFDIIHLDGRLQKEDFVLLSKNITEKTIFILDDFEGIVKGVINYLNLVNNSLISRKTHLLINTINNEIAGRYGLLEKSTTAVVIPTNYINFTNQ